MAFHVTILILSLSKDERQELHLRRSSFDRLRMRMVDSAGKLS